MITYLAKRGFEDPFGVFLEQWDGPQSIRVMTYEDLAAADAVPHGPLVFTDIERLTDADRVLAAHVRRIASEADPDLVILNDPVDTAARFAFLEEAAQQLGNPVRAYRVSERTRPQRYPVFVRYEDDHTGATTELVHSAKELDRALVECVLRGHDLRRLLIVEFVDTRWSRASTSSTRHSSSATRSKRGLARSQTTGWSRQLAFERLSTTPHLSSSCAPIHTAKGFGRTSRSRTSRTVGSTTRCSAVRSSHGRSTRIRSWYGRWPGTRTCTWHASVSSSVGSLARSNRSM